MRNTKKEEKKDEYIVDGKAMKKEEIIHIVNNYIHLVLNKDENEIQIVRFVKIEQSTDNLTGDFYSSYDFKVRVQLLNKFGKKFNQDVYLFITKRDIPNLTGLFSDFKNSYIENLQNLPFIENKEFANSFEEENRLLKERQKKEAEENERIRVIEERNRIISDIRYAVKKRRSAKQLKRSFIKIDTELLESILLELEDEKEIKLLRGVIKELNEIKFSNVSEMIANIVNTKLQEMMYQIEDTFKNDAKKLYDYFIIWYKEQVKKGEFMEETEASLKTLANEYVEQQKWKLFNSVNKYLSELDIISFKKNYARSSNQGFQGSWSITLKDGTKKVFSTESIGAGGYNIQSFHYRYITNLKTIENNEVQDDAKLRDGIFIIKELLEDEKNEERKEKLKDSISILESLLVKD